MSYQKQNFANGEVLTASQLNHIENGIADVESTANATKGVVDKIIDPTLSLSGKAADAAKVRETVNAEAERAKEVESQIKEDIENVRYFSGFKYSASQNKTSEHELVFHSGRYYRGTFVGDAQITVVLYKQEPYNSTEESNIKLANVISIASGYEIDFSVPEQYNYLHVWQNSANAVEIEIEELSPNTQFIEAVNNTYGKQFLDVLCNNTSSTAENITTLTKDKNIVFVIDSPVQDLVIRLCEDETYNKNSTSLFTVVSGYTGDSFTSDIIHLDNDYKSLVAYSKTTRKKYAKVYEVNSILAEVSAKLNVLYKKTESSGIEEVVPVWSQYWFDAAGQTGTTLHTDGVSTDKLQKNGMYLITFPDELTVDYNVKRYEDETLRRNISSYSPFSVIINNDFLRICVKRKDGGTLLPSDALLQQVKIYLVSKIAKNAYISIAPSNATEAKKEEAAITLDGNNDTNVLSAIFGCYNSISVLLYNGTYNIDKMWTYSDTAKISLPFNNYNFDGGANFRRYISICGESPSTPQTLGAVRLCVTKKLHESLQDSGINYFVIGTPYSVSSDAIGRMGTSCILKNINIIGYKYDKPITYVDTTRCLSAMIESVNIRSWAEHIDGYSAFDNTPNQECCGIRVGRGSNYGIQNFVKHLNVWYCGKGIACNGEHFIFEDVKTHHDYIGFVFGDKKTIGKQEHPNIMIGCSIESCYRLMTLSKNGITTPQDYDASLPKSTLIMIGTSTEASWTIPTNEIIDGTTKTKTLPVKEIVKNGWRGRIEIDWSGDLFEPGTGLGFAISKY
mgnify:CR=1 FL=1